MVSIKIIDRNGSLHELKGADGDTVMKVAVNNGIPGINGECGGDLSCGTCHVYVDDAWIAAIDKPSADEIDMLDVVDDPQPTSRLCCQIMLGPELDGLLVKAANN